MGAVAQAVGYALMCWGGPFVLFVLAYIPIGFGLGLQGQSSFSTCISESRTDGQTPK